MTDRVKLKVLIEEYYRNTFQPKDSGLADHLISHGVVVREKGEWRRVYEEGEGWVDICTRCKEIGDETGFCPNCGADMTRG